MAFVCVYTQKLLSKPFLRWVVLEGVSLGEVLTL